MVSADAESNPYELLDLKTEATDAEIRKAYRQRSLKVHPDRNPDNPNAARLFHELTQAYELLLDPLRRLALDAKQRAALARKQRFASHDSKRKDMLEELEAREREFKKARTDKVRAERQREAENDRIKEEGRRMREEREKAMREEEKRGQVQEKMQGAEGGEDDVPVLGALDTTVRLRYALASHPTLTTTAALATLLAPFGSVDESSIVLSMKPPKKAPTKPPKHATALVPFRQIGAAFGAVCASNVASRGLENVEITWAQGKEPELIGWLKRHGQLGASSASTPTSAAPSADAGVRSTAIPNPPTPAAPTPSAPASGLAGASPFSSFPTSFPGAPNLPTPAPNSTSSSAASPLFESLTLMRMRQAERARLEREILAREAEDAGDSAS